MKSQALGTTISRIGLGVVLLAHSVYLKAFVYTLPGTAEFFRSIGLPGVAAYLVFVVEVVAGIALVIGYRSRLASLAVVPVLLGATWAHLPNGWLFTNPGGGWEYPLFLTVIAMAQVALGSGACAIDDALSRRRIERIATGASARTTS